MLENGEIPEELLTVSEVAAALKVPVSWVYERTRRSGTDQERCAMQHPSDMLRREYDRISSGKPTGWNLSAAWIWTWTERRAVLAHGCVQTRPFI
jgi:hypothetical protein